MSEFNITRENAAKGLVAIAAFDLSNARSAAVSTLASVAKELETVIQRRAETDHRLKAKLREMIDRRDGLLNILERPVPVADYPNDEARKSAAASMDAEAERLRNFQADYLAGLLADLDAERALVDAKGKGAGA